MSKIKSVTLPEFSSIKIMYDLLNTNEKDLGSIQNFEYEGLVEINKNEYSLKTNFKIFYKGLSLVDINPEDKDWMMNNSERDWVRFIEKIQDELVTSNAMDTWMRLLEREVELPVEIEMKKERLTRLKEKESYDEEILIGIESKIKQLEDELQEVIVNKITMTKENLPSEAYEALNSLKNEVIQKNLV